MDDLARQLAESSKGHLAAVLDSFAPRIEVWTRYRALGWPHADEVMGIDGEAERGVSTVYAAAVGVVAIQAATGDSNATELRDSESRRIGLFLHSYAYHTMLSHFDNQNPDAGAHTGLYLALNVGMPTTGNSLAKFAYAKSDLASSGMLGESVQMAEQRTAAKQPEGLEQPSYDELMLVDRGQIVKASQEAVRSALQRVGKPAGGSIDEIAVLGAAELVRRSAAHERYKENDDDLLARGYMVAFNTAARAYAERHPKSFYRLLGSDGRDLLQRVNKLIENATDQTAIIVDLQPKSITRLEMHEDVEETTVRPATERAKPVAPQVPHDPETARTEGLVKDIFDAYTDCTDNVNARRERAVRVLAAERARLAAEEAARKKRDAEKEAERKAKEERIKEAGAALLRAMSYLEPESVQEVTTRSEQLGSTVSSLTSQAETGRRYRRTLATPPADWLLLAETVMLQGDAAKASAEDLKFLKDFFDQIANKVLPYIKESRDLIKATSEHTEAIKLELQNALARTKIKLSDEELQAVVETYTAHLPDRPPALLYDAMERMVNTPRLSLNPVRSGRLRRRSDADAVRRQNQVRNTLRHDVESRYGVRNVSDKQLVFLTRCRLIESWDFNNANPVVKEALARRVGVTFKKVNASDVPAKAYGAYMAMLNYLEEHPEIK